VASAPHAHKLATPGVVRTGGLEPARPLCSGDAWSWSRWIWRPLPAGLPYVV